MSLSLFFFLPQHQGRVVDLRAAPTSAAALAPGVCRHVPRRQERGSGNVLFGGGRGRAGKSQGVWVKGVASDGCWCMSCQGTHWRFHSAMSRPLISYTSPVVMTWRRQRCPRLVASWWHVCWRRTSLWIAAAVAVAAARAGAAGALQGPAAGPAGAGGAAAGRNDSVCVGGSGDKPTARRACWAPGVAAPRLGS